MKERKSDVSITAVAFSPDGKRLISADERGLISTIDAHRGRILISTRGHSARVQSIVFRPGKEAYFTADRDGGIREWAVTGRLPTDFRVELGTTWSSMATSPDGKLLALTTRYGGEKDSLQIFDADAGGRVRVLRAGTSPNSVAFSRDGRFLLCTVQDEVRVKLWDVASGQLVWSRTDDRAGPNRGADQTYLSGCAFGPGDDEYLVAINSSWTKSTFCVCELNTGAIRKEFESLSNLTCFAISPDRKWLVTDGDGATVDIWDIKTGRLLRRLAGHHGRVCCLAFSPDSRYVASGGDDHMVIVWEVVTRLEMIPEGPSKQTSGRWR
jgi:WD40 repeat protein